MRQGCSVETAGVVMIAATTDRHRARALPLLYHSILAAPISQMEMNEAFSRPQSHTAGMTVPSAPAFVPPCMNQCCEPVLGGQGPSALPTKHHILQVNQTNQEIPSFRK